MNYKKTLLFNSIRLTDDNYEQHQCHGGLRAAGPFIAGGINVTEDGSSIAAQFWGEHGVSLFIVPSTPDGISTLDWPHLQVYEILNVYWHLMIFHRTFSLEPQHIAGTSTQASAERLMICVIGLKPLLVNICLMWNIRHYPIYRNLNLITS